MAAPPRSPPLSAATSASRSISAPRAVLMRSASGFMSASSRLPIIPVVAGVSGQCSDSTSAVRSSSSSVTRTGRVERAGIRGRARPGARPPARACRARRVAALATALAQRAVAHDAENLAGELADRRARHGELFGARPGAVDRGLTVFAKTVRQQQDRRRARAAPRTRCSSRGYCTPRCRARARPRDRRCWCRSR